MTPLEKVDAELAQVEADIAVMTTVLQERIGGWPYLVTIKSAFQRRLVGYRQEQERLLATRKMLSDPEDSL